MEVRRVNGRVIWVDKTIADRDGVNLDRLRATLDLAGITVVHGMAIEVDDGRVICPGCNEIRIRDRETWEPTVVSPSGWRPVCRECEGTSLSQLPAQVEKREQQYAADPGLRTRPETPGPTIYRRMNNLTEHGQVRRGHRISARLGRFGRV